MSTAHLEAVLNTVPYDAAIARNETCSFCGLPLQTCAHGLARMQSTGGGEVLSLVLMVADSAWNAKDWVACGRAYVLALSLGVDDAAQNSEAQNRLGRIALMGGELEAAVVWFDAAHDICPEAATCVNAAIAYARSKDFKLALRWCAEAIDLDDVFLPAYIQKAAIEQENGDYAAAEKTITEALAICPDNPELLYALSLYQLRRGDFENGWRNYEYRQPRLDLCAKLDEYPEWKGEDLAGKTILVCGEQGMGDQLMWARYLDPLLDMEGNVVLFARPELARLMQMSRVGHNGRFRVLSSDAQLKGLEPDYWVAMGSLAQRFAVDQGRYYMCPTLDDVSRIRAHMAADGNLRVGLCWKGNPQHRYDEYRSMTWADFKPMIDTPGVTFYGLQQGDKESGLVNLIDYCHDMADTTAAMFSLDLVISVDTGMAHLAGAMGKPVWILLGEKCTDWRWGTEGPKSEWYPNAALWRDAITQLRRVSGQFGALLAEHAAAASVQGDAECRKLRHFDAAFAKGRPINPVVTRECKYGTMSWYANDHYIGRALDLYGCYSESEVDLFRRILNPGDVVVEAGANIGALTVALADIVGPAGKVWAFEPQELYFQLLAKNVSRYPRVKACDWALGDTTEMISMRDIETQKVHAPGWESTGTERHLMQQTLDSLIIGGVSFIKVDVDGQELAILKGAEGTIEASRPLIYVENDKNHLYPDLIPWLHAHRYRLYQHLAPLFSADNYRKNPVNVFGSIVSAMLLAVPDERKDLHPCDWGLQRVRMENQ